MSNRAATLLAVFAGLLSACAAPTTTPTDHSSHQSSPTGAQTASSSHTMHQHMEKMKSHMALIRQTTDPAQRQKLLEEHMTMMEEHMSGMGKMK